MNPQSIITDPGRFFEAPVILLERIFSFTVAIMDQAFKFATETFRLMIGG